MKKFILYIYQLPQNILGLLVILFTKAKKKENYYSCEKPTFGVSLGNYIIFGNYEPSEISIKHEQGHQIQSKYLGPLYLILIGIPSFSFNIIDRLFHKKWEDEKREKWYFNLIWEKSADKLGKVERF